MTPPDQSWDEASLFEEPAVEHLRRLGYTYVAREILEAERESLEAVVSTKRLAAALRRLNPWISDDNLQKAIRAVTHVPAASLIEASEQLQITLTYGISLEQDLGDCKTGQAVRFFDFDAPIKNDFVVTRQYCVQGPKECIRSDIVLLVNGVPLVVIECKSPTVGEAWKVEAIDQFSRYQELETRHHDVGAPKLFEPVQVLVATCGQAAVYGTVATPHRFYGEWKQPYPRTVEDLAKSLGREPTAQEILFEGMLAPANLLDLMRNFVVFERDAATGRILRKLCRYHQFGAVNKAVARVRKAQTPTERGGVVWHTQGSGKSLTMLWLALKFRRDPTYQNPIVVIVTDRLDLHDQITRTFNSCGFPNPDRAESVRDLRSLLSAPMGKTILTTMQKFQGGQEPAGSKRKAREEFPVLSEASNVFVLVAEAHRTQYGSLASNLRKALPNAALFGFTGTPIDKQDRSTLSTFGSYIDTYTIEQAVADGTTVPIFYEGRLPELRVIGSTLDALFDRVFADRTEDEREASKKQYATEGAIADAPKRVEMICLDLIEHYTKFIQPNGFKAQVVTCSRQAAVLYKETLDRLNGPPSAVVISGTNKDEDALVKHHTTNEQRQELVRRFIDKEDGLAILVVCNMLLTGFDAPVEQVMYLDAPLKEHTLLQAIARVNRTADGKTYGLIVDYWGVSDALREALAVFAPGDIKGAMTPTGDEFLRLQARHAAAVRFFVRVRDKNDLNACVAILEPEDVRSEFFQAFKRFSQSLDMLLPDSRATPYAADARWLGQIQTTTAAKYRDTKADISDCGEKVRKLIEDAVSADEIQILMEQASFFTPEFEEKLQAVKTDDARASEMEHALRNEIYVQIEANPVYLTSLRERLEQIIADRKAKRIDAAEQLKLFEALTKELRGHAEIAEKIGLTETGFAIYGVLAEPKGLPVVEPKAAPYGIEVDPAKQELALLLEELLAPQTTIVDWIHKDDVQREMRRLIKRQLGVASYPAERVDGLAEAIVDLLKRRTRM